MAKAAARKAARNTAGTERLAGKGSARSGMIGKPNEAKPKVGRVAKKGSILPISRTRFDAVMEAAADSGLLGEKSARIGVRISPALLEQARKQTGIKSNTELIEFALATVAIEDEFGKIFRMTEGTVDPTLGVLT